MKVTNQDYYLDGYLVSNFDTAKKVIKKDWDMVFLVDGYEGTGKSVLAQQLAYYVDETFNVERVTFTPEEFTRAIEDANKYEAVVYDEAYTGLASRSAMSNINRALVRMLAEIRQKNLFVFIVMPTFFDLDRYVALWRSRALLHIYTGDGFERGYFAFYNMDKKKQLYTVGKKFYSYGGVKPNFTGRFTNHYTVNEDEYRRRKGIALKNNTDVRGATFSEGLRSEKERVAYKLFPHLGRDIKVTRLFIQDISGLKNTTYHKRLNDYYSRKNRKND